MNDVGLGPYTITRVPKVYDDQSIQFYEVTGPGLHSGGTGIERFQTPEWRDAEAWVRRLNTAWRVGKLASTHVAPAVCRNGHVIPDGTWCYTCNK